MEGQETSKDAASGTVQIIEAQPWSGRKRHNASHPGIPD